MGNGIPPAKSRSTTPSEWFFAWGLPLVAVITAAAGPIMVETAGSTWPERLTMVTFWVGAGLFAVAAVFTVWGGVRSVRNASQVRGTLTRFNHALGDTIRALDTLLTSDKSSGSQDVFFHHVVAEAKTLIPIESPRVCVYLLEARDEEEGSAEFLRLAATGGRQDPPRQRFEGETPYGASAIRVAKERNVKCIDDWQHPPRGIEIQRDDDALWRSYMMVPLHVDGTPRGLLTIDTTERTSFTDEHIAVARTIGSFLGLGMLDVSSAAADTTPEVRAVLAQIVGAGTAPSSEPPA